MGGDTGGCATDRDVTISIHAPRMGGDSEIGKNGPIVVISIHAPRMGGDLIDKYTAFGGGPFQSTPPAWGATG